METPDLSIYSLLSFTLTLAIKVLSHTCKNSLDSEVQDKIDIATWKWSNNIIFYGGETILVLVGIVSTFIDVESKLPSIWIEIRYVFISLSLAIPFLVLASILIEWSKGSLITLRNQNKDKFDELNESVNNAVTLPHNYIIEPLSKLEKENVSIGDRYGAYIGIMEQSFESLKRFNSDYKYIANDFLTSMMFKIIPSKLLDSSGKVVKDKGFKCVDLTVNMEGYIDILGHVYDTFTSSYGEGEFDIRILSPFQPVEWFYNPRSNREVSSPGKITDLMSLMYNRFNNNDVFRRYIPSNRQMVEIQRNLKIIRKDSNMPFYEDMFPTDEIVQDSAFLETYPFFEDGDTRILGDYAFWVVDSSKSVLEDKETIDLLSNFCFGDTHLVYDKNIVSISPQCEGAEVGTQTEPYEFRRFNHLEIGTQSLFRLYGEINSKSQTYSTRNFDEILWVGKAGDSVLGIGIDVISQDYVNLCVFPDVGEAEDFGDLFTVLDSYANSSEGEYDIIKIGSNCR